MAWNRKLQQARQSLDQKLRAFQPAGQHPPPAKGWIRALRNALGLSAAQLGDKLGVRPQSIDDLERSEAAGTISLDAIARVGQAMDCTLVYALVPNTSLETIVQRRAEALAMAAIAGVAHTMALEDQQVPSPLGQQVKDYIEDHISERDLWRDNG
ncbi:mobile mystery protein A [Devosia sp. Root635]|uniref:mobile mystery protein A n=1 Tax=Devosia sp. Root635 TaxID=1736575 RepID=UPI0006F3D4AD|nr:mobile mystery protein A [Devosia sp. Root635]KRA56070.1 transcriptional regulator [Devosia sp. Root635]